jgi:hypothetical protein
MNDTTKKYTVELTEEQLKKLGIEVEKPQWPSEGEETWVLYTDGDIKSSFYTEEYKFDLKVKSQGNIFRTKAEAEQESERRTIMQELRECDGVVEFNRMEKVWQISCNLNGIAFYPDWSNVTKRLGDVYFDSKGSAKAAIQKLGDTKLRKLFRVEG